MEKYNNIFKELRSLFPHSTDISITVKTDNKDIEAFSKQLNELSKSQFFIITGQPERTYKSFTSSFGSIHLENN